MPAPAIRMPAGTHEPTIFDKMKMGALTGGAVGLTMGFLLGSFSIIRSGPGPKGAMRTLGQYCFSSAASFGFFLTIASVIRSDDKYQFETRTPLLVEIAHHKPGPRLS